MGSLFCVVLVGLFEVAENLEICGFCGGLVDLVLGESLWEECLSAQEVGEMKKIIRRGGDLE